MDTGILAIKSRRQRLENRIQKKQKRQDKDRVQKVEDLATESQRHKKKKGWGEKRKKREIKM